MTAKRIEVKNLIYKKILTEVNFEWSQNETIALMGPNGSGKSTLARLLTGLEQPSGGEIALLQEGQTVPWEKVQRWQEVAIVGQHPRRQTLGATVAEELGFGLVNLGYGVQEVKDRVQEIAERIGLEKRLNQSPATLSGGERQRLVVAAILLLEPSFLILDEALSMLDQRAQERILELLHLRDWSKTLGSTPLGSTPRGQLWITHDPKLARRADRLLILKSGKLIDAGRPENILSNERLCQEFKISCLRGLRTVKGLSLSPSPSLSYSTEGKNSSPHGETDSVFEWQHVQYKNRVTIDQKKVRQGEMIGIVGPSGAGKTTLIEGMAGLRFPIEGQLFAFGERLTPRSVNSLRSKIQLLQQEAGEYLIGGTVLQEIFYHQSRAERKALKQENLRNLRTFGIPDSWAERRPEWLSGGERQKVAFAAALETVPEILLLDEPLLGLDTEAQDVFWERIRSLKEHRCTLFLITHDLREIIDWADRLWLIEDGQITVDCPADQWLQYAETIQQAGVRI